MTWVRGGRRAVGLAPLAAVFVATLFVAYWQAFNVWQPWDDEGSWLESMRVLLHGASLYGDLYAFHGPFNFELWSLFYGFDPSQPSADTARLIVIGIWTLSALGAGLAVRRLTSNTWLGVAAQIVWFSGSRHLDNEPGHPVSTITLLLAIAGIAFAYAMPQHPRRGMAVLGIAAGLLTATKVNVGGLVVVAVVFAAALTLPTLTRFQKIAVVGTIVVPGALMSGDLGTESWRSFAFVVTLGIIAIAVAASAVPDSADISPGGRRGSTELQAFGLGFTAALVGAILLTLPYGSNPIDVVHGIFITPLKHAEVNNYPLPLTQQSAEWSVVSVAAALVARALVLNGRMSLAWSALLRLTAGLVIWAAVGTVVPGMWAPRTGAMLTTPLLCVWVAALPVTAKPERHLGRFVSTGVAAIAALQTLHVYPVASSQLSPAAVFFVFAGAVCLRDGLGELTADPRLTTVLPRRLIGGGLAAVLCLTVLIPGLSVTSRNYRQGRALPFPGAARMRLPAGQATALIRMTSLLRQECDSVVGLPGVLSFNAWTEIPLVGTFTVDDWMYIISAGKQQAIVNEWLAHRRPCAIRSNYQLASYQAGRPLPNVPLVHAIESMVVVARVPPFDLLVSPARARKVRREIGVSAVAAADEASERARSKFEIRPAFGRFVSQRWP